MARSRPIFWKLLVPGLAIAAVLVPGAPMQALGGVPLGVAGLAALGGVLYAALALPAPRTRSALVLALGFGALILAKLALAATAPPIGLQATYWASATPSGKPAADRRETSLDLVGEQFGVFFFNDAARFNFGPDVQPGRDQLPFSVHWAGWLLIPSDAARRLALESDGPGRMVVDGIELDPSQALSPGVHAIEVDYARPAARVPRLRLSWSSASGGTSEVVPSTSLRWREDGRDATPWLVAGRVADVALGVMVLVWLGAGLLGLVGRRGARWRAALGAVPLVFAAAGMLSLAPMTGRVTILSGLDDWLVYESSARDIVLNGVLMTGGQDHAAAYYGQPLYPYALALAHLMTGESLFGALVLQFAALGFVALGTFGLARRAFGSREAGLWGLACVWVLMELEPEHFKVARQLFNENLYMPLVMASLCVCVALARRARPPAWWRLGLFGFLLGLTAISRSQFLLFVPFGLLALALAWRRRAVALVLVVAGLCLAIAPVTLRNYVVSGQLVLISASGGASLLEFHRPPPGLVDSGAIERDPLYQALHLDIQTRTVLAFARADPAGYLRTLLPLGAHSLGLQGRNDPGVYWPLFVTVLLYVAAFALRETRRLHVWPIHAFVLSHLLVLMLFEADTYGYRLVVPMYAPMAAVAAQVPLRAVSALLERVRGSAGLAYPRLIGTVAAIAVLGCVVQQSRTLVEGWPERETSIHGLGGLAAHAASTAERTSAEAIYVASVDGTPRRYGAGNLPGLQYPWLKWFDPSRSVPLPQANTRAVYALGELQGHTGPGDLVACLGTPDASGEITLAAEQARASCGGDWPASTSLGATFEGAATVERLLAPSQAAAGTQLDVRLVWQPLAARPEPQQMSLHLEDPQEPDGIQWGNGTLELYPANEWQPGEAVLSRLPVATDPTAIPQAYQLTLGVGPVKAGAPAAVATWQGRRIERVPVGSVTLAQAAQPMEAALPADMRPIEGAGLKAGGLELVGARALPAEASAGGSIKIGLIWRALQDAPNAGQAQLRLVRQNGEVVQQTAVPLFGGRVAPASLLAGSMVRDEETLTLAPERVSGEALGVEVGLLDTTGAALADRSVRLGTLQVVGRSHQIQALAPGQTPEATFGGAMQLLEDQLQPAQAGPGANVTVKLRWRAAKPMPQAYKVFVHVLDASAQNVIAQRDAEPLNGDAPTSSWVEGEVLDDQYQVALPANVAPGSYPIEIGAYDGKTGARLAIETGDNRFLLSSKLQVR